MREGPTPKGTMARWYRADPNTLRPHDGPGKRPASPKAASPRESARYRGRTHARTQGRELSEATKYKVKRREAPSATARSCSHGPSLATLLPPSSHSLRDGG